MDNVCWYCLLFLPRVRSVYSFTIHVYKFVFFYKLLQFFQSESNFDPLKNNDVVSQ